MSLWNLERSDGVVELVYDNPPRNFLTFAALEELGTRLTELADDPDTAVIVLSSADTERFVAHADLDELSRLADGPVPEARAWYTTMRLIETMPQPVIAAIDGQAWGGGLELSLACTLRWASPRAHFSAIETALGIVPGAGGSQRLIRLIGRGPATDLVITGLRVDAARAAQLGIVSRVFTGDFRAEVLAAATELARLPRAAVAAAKRVVREGAELGLSDALRLEGGAFGELLATPESLRLQQAARERYAASATGDPVGFAGLGESA
ncbi:enoyl-CoA hydratase/isomerase family protein [Nocardioides carbamazepini]|uniref:enoyl-CoA hydratase/isomerase family protein n=1 Tax=Nocardioides carbamazepini TaxID=2854259 RepID=UPI002149BAEC|nr:enoyl-CoA hydratase/isomerase family protein [Nocardioides carbamazepini]MCR1784120.1 enoyl-CoA hydratase/isomerase family protein [Nocardioides carbamazepini]